MPKKNVQFIPSEWLERAAFWQGLVAYSRPIDIPCNPGRRKTAAVECLLQKTFGTMIVC
jgi:hypothetical protein